MPRQVTEIVLPAGTILWQTDGTAPISKTGKSGQATISFVCPCVSESPKARSPMSKLLLSFASF